MGQHTWFYKDQELRAKEVELWKKLDQHDDGTIWLDDMEIYQINHEIDEIVKSNGAEFHDLFRTGKRNEDGTYTDDVILSKEQCDKWLKDNSDTVSFRHVYWETEEVEAQHRAAALKSLNEFWEKYPKGCIDFG